MSDHSCIKEDMLNIMRDDVKEIRKDVKYLIKTTSALKVKAGVAGLVSGSIGTAVVLALKYIK